MLNLAEYQKRPKRLADYLPWAALVAPGIVLNKDGALQRTIRYRGPDLESASPEELLSYTARVNNVLRRFRSGWVLHFEAARIPASDYPTSAWPCPLSFLIDEERRAAFESTAEYFECEYFLTFAYMPPADRTARAERAFLKQDELAAPNHAGDRLGYFVQETDKAIDLLALAMPKCRPLDDDETLAYLHACVSSKRHDIVAPETPLYLDALLVDEPLTGGLEPKLGEAHLRVISVLGFPPASEPGFLDSLNALAFPYRWTTRFIAMDKARASAELAKYRRQWFAKRKSIAAIIKETLFNEASALGDTDADNKTADADAALQELGADDVSFGFLTTSIVVHDQERSVVDQCVREIERVLNERGFVTIRESVNAVDAWLGSLPGHLYANIRQPLVHTLNLAHIAPLSSVWAGPARNDHLEGPPLVLATTRGHTPFRLSTHIGDVGHTLIVGPTGAGKSVLLAFIAAQFHRYENAQVFAFDKGRSIRAACLGLEGVVYDLGSKADLSFQPLRDLEAPEDKARAQRWLLGLLAQEGVTADPPIKEAVWSALSSLAAAPTAERTLTGFSLLVQDRSLRNALKPFTVEGAFGDLFDADKEVFSFSNLVCFEMEELMRQQSAIAPALTYLFDRLEERFNGNPTLLLLDEAWLFLDNPMFSGRIRDWLKTLRKKNVSVIFATQSLSDVQASPIAPAIIESCPSRIFLPNPRARESSIYSAYANFGLNGRQIDIIASMTPKQEYYYQSPVGNRIFDLRLGDIALAFCGASSPQDHRLIDKILCKASDAPFAQQLLAAKGLDWAAALLPEPSSSKGERE
ncbi:MULTISPECIES: conjugal transfer protein TrbE [Hyphococcus]|uniref:Conjugal transfer protein TrbE n=1 Tax=Hyphococcus luteus TaxID=2058213 RepID=A0A2S7K112_9PROT|nr:conjugal transfer protein TrbE [Marinicaulis flavus]PQA86205.1 conjugal transfer protein TrbE [Marinicaulis flavus]